MASLRDALKKEEQGQYIPSDVWKWVNDRENIPLLLGVGHLERAKAVGPASGAQFRGAELLERARAALTVWGMFCPCELVRTGPDGSRVTVH